MTTLGPYTLLHRIGAGGMGEVWIARRNALGGAAKLFALKTVLPEKASDAESRRQFLDEARLSMLMSNSNIVQVFDVAETTGGVCYMAMEYVEGIDLARLNEELRLRKEFLSHSVIAYIVGEILKALVYAHDLSIEGIRRSIIHRDISPQNVMLSISGEVKVMDFGIARLSSDETTGNFIRGKLRYMPPEQFKKGVRAPTIDLFAVGAILHELLDGQRFRSGNYEEAELLGMCMNGFVPQLMCPPGRVPTEFDRLRKALLEPSAKRRIESARAAHRLLTQWPGDRDAKFELEALVRRSLGASTLAGAATQDAPPAELSNTVQEPAPDPVRSSAVTIRRGGESSEVTARRARELSVVHDKSRTFVPMRVQGGSNRRPWFLAVALCAGLGLAAVGVGATSGWRVDEEPVAPTAEAPAARRSEPPRQAALAKLDTVEATKVENAAEGSSPPIVGLESASVADLALEPEPVVASEPAPAVEPERKPKPQKKKPKTLVIIKPGGAWAQVQIDRKGKIHEYYAMKDRKPIRVELDPGEHEVWFRDAAEDDLRLLDKVTVSLDGPVILTIKDDKITVGG